MGLHDQEKTLIDQKDTKQNSLLEDSVKQKG